MHTHVSAYITYSYIYLYMYIILVAILTSLNPQNQKIHIININGEQDYLHIVAES